MNHIESQARRADPTAIAAILNDPCDEPLRNKATRVALEILKLAPDLPGAKQDIMLTSLARYAGKTYVACSTAHHTTLFMGKHAFVLARDTGGYVPWVATENMNVPDMSFFKYRVRVDDRLSEHLVAYVNDLMTAERLAVAAAVDHEEDECSAPAP